jgi:hypothetical protein
MGRQPRGRRGDSPCDAFRTAERTRGALRGPFSNARERGLGSKSQIPVYTTYALELLWTVDAELALNTMLPAVTFVLILLLIVATTSIKTNLGIVLGAASAGLVYARHFAGTLRRTALPLTALVVLTAFAVSSNEALRERLQEGVGRAALGVEVLQSRDDVEGHSARWMRTGLAGWTQNPLFGHGVEGFRSRFGTTSHSTPVDLLYNSGVIRLGLFYGIFASIVWRLVRLRRTGLRGAGAMIFGALVCYMFISLSGTMHYSASLAVFVAISTALLHQRAFHVGRCVASAEAARS